MSDNDQAPSTTVYVGTGDSDHGVGDFDEGSSFNVDLSMGLKSDNSESIEDRMKGDLSFVKIKTVGDHGLYILSAGIRYPFSDTWTVQPYVGVGVATFSDKDFDESFGDNVRMYGKLGTDIPLTNDFRIMLQWQRFFDMPDLENMFSLGVGWSF